MDKVTEGMTFKDYLLLVGGVALAGLAFKHFSSLDKKEPSDRELLMSFMQQMSSKDKKASRKRVSFSHPSGDLESQEGHDEVK
jgi:hypothetical protein